MRPHSHCMHEHTSSHQKPTYTFANILADTHTYNMIHTYIHTYSMYCTVICAEWHECHCLGRRQNAQTLWYAVTRSFSSPAMFQSRCTSCDILVVSQNLPLDLCHPVVTLQQAVRGSSADVHRVGLGVSCVWNSLEVHIETERWCTPFSAHCTVQCIIVYSFRTLPQSIFVQLWLSDKTDKT